MSHSSLPDGLQVFPIPAFSDNYIWCFYNDGHAMVVDPGDATPVLQFMQDKGLTLDTVLVTHHHADHTGGLKKLRSEYPSLTVIGPQNPKIAGLTERVTEGQAISIGVLDLQFDVLELPGHTLDHIAFVGHGGVLCGDTLFSAGCGRLFEGTPSQMMSSLAKLSALPDSTKVWCTHEYTLANLRFANAVEPNNQMLKAYTDWAQNERAHERPTLPSTIGEQKAVNPFLRAHSDEVKQTAQQQSELALNTELDVFTAVRRWKDNF